MIKIFQDADLMIEKSLCGFAFEGLIFYEFNSNGLLIYFVYPEVDLAEAALSNPI